MVFITKSGQRPAMHLRCRFERYLEVGESLPVSYIFNFMENPAIPTDNNASERRIRKVEIKMKNSGTFRSEQGAGAFFDVLSIVETAKKHD